MPQEVYTENGIADLTGRKIENPQRLQPALLLLLCMGEGDSGNSNYVPVPKYQTEPADNCGERRQLDSKGQRDGTSTKKARRMTGNG